MNHFVTLDFETFYDKSFSLTKMTTMEYVQDDRFKVWGVGIKINHDATEWYGEDECEDALRALDWDNVTLLCHNTLFDAYILTQYYGLTPKYYVDTAAMSRGLFPGQSARLKDCAIRAFPTDDTMRKGDELADAKGIYDLDPEPEASIAGYCTQDVDLTRAIYDQWVVDMPTSEMDLIDITCRMFCEPKLVVDHEALIEFRDSEITASKTAIEKSGIERKILSSNQQFAAYIENELHLVPPTKRSPTTGKFIPALGKNDKAFTQLQSMYPEHQLIWDARKAAKSRINETRAQRFIDATNKDGTLSVPLRYYAAHTGRFGGTEKINMQNMPRNSPMRKALCAPPGKLVFVADLSNIEARMLAWLADEHDLLNQFRNGDDIYSNLASIIYDRPINKNDDPTERFVGKTAVLGLGYGMGAAKFQSTLETGAMGPPMTFTNDQALSVVSTYRNTYFGIPLLWQKLELKLMQTLQAGYEEDWHGLRFKDKKIHLPNGMALHYNELHLWDGKLTYKGRGLAPETTWGGRIAENVVQALSRIVVTDAMLRIKDDPTLNADIVLTVHDEIIIISDANDADATMQKLIQHMCTPPAWAPDIPLDAEGGYDISYSK